jgi:hypothetical protein
MIFKTITDIVIKKRGLLVVIVPGSLAPEVSTLRTELQWITHLSYFTMFTM